MAATSPHYRAERLRSHVWGPGPGNHRRAPAAFPRRDAPRSPPVLGEQRRLLLEPLLRGADAVRLLDEPDDYLDVPGKRWLGRAQREADRRRKSAPSLEGVSSRRRRSRPA